MGDLAGSINEWARTHLGQELEPWQIQHFRKAGEMSDPFKSAVRNFFDEKGFEEVGIPPVEPSADVLREAQKVRGVYVAYRQVGFTHSESMELIRYILWTPR